MFEELIRELRRLDGAQVSVPLQTDGEGYLDRECPNAKCMFLFKVEGQDWSGKVRDEEVFCPFCRHAAPATEWHTQEQVRQAEEHAFAHIERSFDNGLKRSVERFNRSQPRDSFIKVTMQVKSAPQRILLPAVAAEPMRLKIACEACGCRYAVIGAAFFCPACGQNAAGEVFSQSVSGIRKTMQDINTIRSAISDRDAAELTCRNLIENGLQNAITAFQRYAEVLYERLPNRQPARRNVFQNLQEGSDLWKASAGKGYDKYLNNLELRTLNRYFQQRHLLAHRQGIVDSEYITKSGDTSYQTGQRIVVEAGDVLECLDLIEKLARGLN